MYCVVLCCKCKFDPSQTPKSQCTKQNEHNFGTESKCMCIICICIHSPQASIPTIPSTLHHSAVRRPCWEVPMHLQSLQDSNDLLLWIIWSWLGSREVSDPVGWSNKFKATPCWLRQITPMVIGWKWPCWFIWPMLVGSPIWEINDHFEEPPCWLIFHQFVDQPKSSMAWLLSWRRLRFLGSWVMMCLLLWITSQGWGCHSNIIHAPHNPFYVTRGRTN